MLSHGVEHIDSLDAVTATEFHQSEQQQSLLTGTNLSVQIGADATDGVLCIQVVSHLVGHTHVAIQVEIKVGIADTQMATQIADEHVFCPLLIYLLFLSEKSKQTDETG